MSRRFSLAFLSLFLVSLAPTALAALTIQSWPASTSGVDISGDLKQLVGLIEPSGLTWHSGRQQLLVVGDEGQLAALNRDGSTVTLWYPGGDLEDVTVVDPSTSVVYLANEDGSIYSYDLSTKKVVQSWDVSALFPEIVGAGMEGLTYAEGYFYAGYQKDGKVYKLDLSQSTVKVVSTFAALSGSGYTDLAALHFSNGYLYGVYDAGDLLFQMDLEGTVKNVYSLPGQDQEGFAIGEDTNADGDADAYVAQDSGGIMDYDGFALPVAPTLIPVPTVTDNDKDGSPVESDCTDNDASVSSLKTYYVDADKDGLGSQSSSSLCSATAPYAYSLNNSDTNDTIPNAGVEISGDGKDNDGDGLVDEVNTLASNGVHPYYGTLDVNTSATKKIVSFTGIKNGHVLVRYADNSIYDYSALNVTTKTAAGVSLKKGTAYLVVKVGRATVTLNGYTGAVLSN